MGNFRIESCLYVDCICHEYGHVANVEHARLYQIDLAAAVVQQEMLCM